MTEKRSQVGTEDNFKVVKIERNDEMPGSFVQELFIFLMIHYLWWFAVPIVIWFVAYSNGYHYYLIPLVLFYLPSFLDNSHLHQGRPWHSFRTSSVWRFAHKYAGCEVIRTEKLDPSKSYIFAVHPHGILILSRMLSYGGLWELLFPGIDFRVLGATPMFWIPGAREICLWMCAVDASKKSAKRVLHSGKSLMIYPGGSKEIFATDPSSKETRVVLKERKGFVKLALEHGASLVPVVIYGEKFCYNKLEINPAVKSWFMKTLKVPLLIFWGRYFSWTPKKQRIAAVYGKPIPVEKIEHPTEEQVNKLHEVYVNELRKLFDEYKTRYPESKDQILVIE